MLHQTLPVFFHFNPPSPLPSPSFSPRYSLSHQEETEMEAKALKTSFWPEMTQHAVVDDVWGANVVNGVSGDDFFVDELLNFSKEEEGFLQEDEQDCGGGGGLGDDEKDSGSVSSHEEDHSLSNGFSLKHDFDSLPTSELSVPTDDLADLEWLSHFVDDSFTEFSLPQPTPIKPQPQTGSGPPKTGDYTLKTGTFPTPIPVKARTKRSRTGGRVWSTGSTTTSSSSSNSSSNSCLIFNNTPHNLGLFYCLARPPVKKQKKKHVAENGGSFGGGVQRRCSHCGVQKTPQWRSGPMGAKTLCNACGVRYKSGRLLPEYRPACSPTFSSEVHSNSHRKVLEMRRKKEMVVGSEAVNSF